MENNENEQKKSKKYILILFLLLLIIVILIIAIIILKRTRGPDNGGVSLYIDKDAGEYVAATKENNTLTKNVAIPGWGSITIPKNETKVKVEFTNPKENEGLYYLTFELRLPDNSEQGYEVLYTSGLVEPGLYIQNIELSRALEEGTYDAIIHVQPYRMDENKTPTNNADMQTKLIVN